MTTPIAANALSPPATFPTLTMCVRAWNGPGNVAFRSRLHVLPRAFATIAVGTEAHNSPAEPWHVDCLVNIVGRRGSLQAFSGRWRHGSATFRPDICSWDGYANAQLGATTLLHLLPKRHTIAGVVGC